MNLKIHLNRAQVVFWPPNSEFKVKRVSTKKMSCLMEPTCWFEFLCTEMTPPCRSPWESQTAKEQTLHNLENNTFWYRYKSYCKAFKKTTFFLHFGAVIQMIINIHNTNKTLFIISTTKTVYYYPPSHVMDALIVKANYHYHRCLHIFRIFFG